MRRAVAGAALLAIAALIAIGGAYHRPARAAGTCAAPDTRIVVDTASHRVLLCDHDQQAVPAGAGVGKL